MTNAKLKTEDATRMQFARIFPGGEIAFARTVMKAMALVMRDAPTWMSVQHQMEVATAKPLVTMSRVHENVRAIGVTAAMGSVNTVVSMSMNAKYKMEDVIQMPTAKIFKETERALVNSVTRATVSARMAVGTSMNA